MPALFEAHIPMALLMRATLVQVRTYATLRALQCRDGHTLRCSLAAVGRHAARLSGARPLARAAVHRALHGDGHSPGLIALRYVVRAGGGLRCCLPDGHGGATDLFDRRVYAPACFSPAGASASPRVDDSATPVSMIAQHGVDDCATLIDPPLHPRSQPAVSARDDDGAEDGDEDRYAPPRCPVGASRPTAPPAAGALPTALPGADVVAASLPPADHGHLPAILDTLALVAAGRDAARLKAVTFGGGAPSPAQLRALRAFEAAHGWPLLVAACTIAARVGVPLHRLDAVAARWRPETPRPPMPPPGRPRSVQDLLDRLPPRSVYDVPDLRPPDPVFRAAPSPWCAA